MDGDVERRTILSPTDLPTGVLQRIFAYWLDKCAGRPFPARDDIDPVDFPYALGNVNLLEVEEGPVFRFRLTGTKAVALHGYEMRGKTVEELADPAQRDRLSRSFRRVVEEGRALHIIGRSISIEGAEMSFESLYLPLGQDGKVTMIMVVGGQRMVDPIRWANRPRSGAAATAPLDAERPVH